VGLQQKRRMQLNSKKVANIFSSLYKRKNFLDLNNDDGNHICPSYSKG